MFRSLLAAGCAAALLSGCATSGGIDVKKVQETAVNICKFEPSFQTVTNIFNSGSPLLDSIQEIAGAVCNAVNTPRSAGQPPKVNGVVVEGRRV
jgi:hypothetical protein